MVLNTDHNNHADVIFVIESTAINGAYFQDIKSNYLIPALEYFSQGGIDERDYGFETTTSLYGVVLYRAADCLPSPSCDTFGPYTTASRVLNAIDKLELVGGKGESHANIAEGLATALQCLEELGQKREPNATSQRHCILICNSPPYLMHVMETHAFQGKTADQLASILQERGINLSIISPRKIPALFKLYEKAGGDLSSFPTKNYAKDPRHLVLLKGFSLKEIEISAPSGSIASNANQHVPTCMPPSSMPSPLSNTDTPMTAVGPPQTVQANLINPNVVGQNPIFRPNQNIPGMPGIPAQCHPSGGGQMPMGVPGAMPGPGRAVMTCGGPQFPNQMPPGYHQTPAGVAMGNRPPPKWSHPMIQTHQRPPGQYPAVTQSALITQLQQPTIGGNVNQFNPRNDGILPTAGNNQQPVRMILNNPNVNNNQTSMPPQMPMAQPPQMVMSQAPPNQTVTNTPATSVASMPQGAAGQANPPGQQQTNPQGQQVGTVRERQTIWKGILEWIEKAKPNDQEKIRRHVPCQVSANAKDGQPELTANAWPQKLIMQLMPKQLIGNIGGHYLKNSKSVLFHPEPCEALESLTKVMSSGVAGCVHFTSSVPNTCDIKVLILLYTAEKRAYLGFIPNDQVAFVGRLRNVIKEQKTNQIMRHGGPTPNQMNPSAPPNQTIGQQGPMQVMAGPAGSPSTSLGGGVPNQSPVMQTNATINTNNPQGQQPQGNMMAAQCGPNNPGQRMSMPGMPPGTNAPIQTNAGGVRPGQPGPMIGGTPQQRAATFDHLARQQNLEKIMQLKQTLEQAQQQEAQYKNQLEIMNHVKQGQQLQEALQAAQQQEMQYKQQIEQEQNKQLRAQLQQMQQQQRGQMPPQMQQVGVGVNVAPGQRMMRPGPGPGPVLSNNPGLRHLLQQQPQYRPQMMNMPMSGAGPRGPQMVQQMNTNQNKPNQFDEVSNFDFM